MITNTVIDEIINNLEVGLIPHKYIVMARYVDFQGVEHTVSGNDLETFLTNPYRNSIAKEAKLVLDVRAMRDAAISESIDFFLELSQRLRELPKTKH